ncbi:MAG: LacI family DNA-binding transcriptional regulator [Miniphocaeibacter sp.]|uniref:LacI family DNA-binding transcriptional regulator n=1 Tax=Miniphocaeibacter sp. TaxID=3100973 RepID=UPI0017B9EB7F|nr:LacI family transcriptional regulator [Gallicola sp.]
MISIREVAKLAGVSPSTVSRVINGTAKVDEEKKKRVLKVIEETDFKPNQVARSLFKKSSSIIGLILPNTNNPFFTEIIKYIEDEAYKQNYKILISYSDNNPKKEKENLDMLISMNADGIILLTSCENIKNELKNIPIPVVIIDRSLDYSNNLTQLACDHYKGAKLATEHLVECGCKNIVNMKGPMEFSSARLRYKGYIDVCQKMSLDIMTIDCDYDYDSGIRSTEKLLKKYPEVDGIVASNDIVAIAVYKVLAHKGIDVPEKVMIVGFDNISFASVFTPEITTIEQPMEKMGRKAVNSIIDFKKNKTTGESYIFDVKLIQRQTTFFKEGV